MSVRAKCRVTGRHESHGLSKGTGVEFVNVTLQPVYSSGDGDDAANKEWSKWTPSGQIQLTITNPDAYKQFELGKAYYVDFTPAEE